MKKITEMSYSSIESDKQIQIKNKINSISNTLINHKVKELERLEKIYNTKNYDDLKSKNNQHTNLEQVSKNQILFNEESEIIYNDDYSELNTQFIHNNENDYELIMRNDNNIIQRDLNHSNRSKMNNTFIQQKIELKDDQNYKEDSNRIYDSYIQTLRSFNKNSSRISKTDKIQEQSTAVKLQNINKNDLIITSFAFEALKSILTTSSYKIEKTYSIHIKSNSEKQPKAKLVTNNTKSTILISKLKNKLIRLKKENEYLSLKLNSLQMKEDSNIKHIKELNNINNICLSKLEHNTICLNQFENKILNLQQINTELSKNKLELDQIYNYSKRMIKELYDKISSIKGKTPKEFSIILVDVEEIESKLRLFKNIIDNKSS